MPKIEISLNKTKILLLLLGSIAFVILGVLFTLTPENYTSSLHRIPVLIRIVGILSIIFFGITTIYGVFKIFDKSAGLIIDENGITDNTNFTSVGLIKWKDIKKINTGQVASTSFLLVYVRNPKQYIEKTTFIKRKLMERNLKMFGTALSITSNTLRCKSSELEKLINENFEKYKQKMPNR